MKLIHTELESLKTSFICLLDEVRPSCLNGQDVAYLLKVREELIISINNTINASRGEKIYILK